MQSAGDNLDIMTMAGEPKHNLQYGKNPSFCTVYVHPVLTGQNVQKDVETLVPVLVS